MKAIFFVAFNGENVDIVAHIRHNLGFRAEILYQIILLLESGGFFKSKLFRPKNPSLRAVFVPPLAYVP